MFIGNVNTHDEEWFGSSTTTVRGRAYRDSAFIYLSIYLSQPLNQWALLSTRLFRQPNYWRSASYATCVAKHVDLT